MTGMLTKDRDYSLRSSTYSAETVNIDSYLVSTVFQRDHIFWTVRSAWDRELWGEAQDDWDTVWVVKGPPSVSALARGDLLMGTYSLGNNVLAALWKPTLICKNKG